MNNPQAVYDFLKANPRDLFCDDCIAKGSGVSSRSREVNTIARTLALFPQEFTRRKDVCRNCQQNKECTMAL